MPQKGVVQYGACYLIVILVCGLQHVDTLFLVILLGISPNSQRACKNMFRSYLFNGYRRLSGQLPYWIVPVAIGTPLNSSREPELSLLTPSRLRHVRMGEEVRRVAK